MSAYGYYPAPNQGYAGYAPAPGSYPQYPYWNAGSSYYPNTSYPNPYYPNLQYSDPRYANSYYPHSPYAHYPSYNVQQNWPNYSSPYGYGWPNSR